MAEPLGKWNVLLAFIGFHLTFFPMHITGILGMPRRVYTYPHGVGWDTLNLVSSVGAFVFAASVLLFFGNALVSLRRGRVAGANPWDASTLEWATASPPPVYNFAHLPVVEGRAPLWISDDLPAISGLSAEKREVLLTTVIDAVPDVRDISPAPSVWPLIAAIVLTIGFIGSIFTPWAVVWGAIPVAIALTIWFWPKPGVKEDES
jgi:cytochrome c oxidase subunit I+III